MGISIDHPLSALLKSTDISEISIPIFQRPYSWTQEQIRQFLLDLDSSVNKKSRHFYGLIVYVFQDKKSLKIDIIDGQQRLTTVIITLAVLRDMMEDMNQNTQWSEQDEERNNEEILKIKTSIYSKKKCKLHSSNEGKYENEFLEIIQKSILDFTDPNVSPRKEYDQQKTGSKDRFEVKKNHLFNLGDKRITKSKNSYKNYLIVHDYFEGLISKETTNEDKFELLIKYSDSLLEEFRYIPFEVESYEQAFEYFEVLNDRGLDISALDLIKNECLKKQLTDVQRKEVFDYWTEIFSVTLDQTCNLIQFVRYAYMQEHGHITKREIYASFKKELKDLTFNSLKTFLTGKLLTRAKIYKDLISDDTNLDPKYHNVIQLLKSTKTVQWYSIAMAVLEPLYTSKKISKKTGDAVVLLLESIHEIMFTINFVNVVTNSIETKFPEIAMLIKYDNEIEYLKLVEKSINEINSLKLLSSLQFSKIEINRVSTFEANNDLGNMFIFLFKYFDKKSSDDKFYIGSLEHLFPQKPNEKSWPVINLVTPEEKKNMTYSIGNFFITNRILNPSLGNKSFEDKRQEYEQNHIYDILPLQDPLHYANIKDWTPQIIIQRTDWILEKFKNVF
jgi:uncharacterized protein with ParB-like and HNH nuclease domain